MNSKASKFESIKEKTGFRDYFGLFESFSFFLKKLFNGLTKRRLRGLAYIVKLLIIRMLVFSITSWLKIY